MSGQNTYVDSYGSVIDADTGDVLHFDDVSTALESGDYEYFLGAKKWRKKAKQDKKAAKVANSNSRAQLRLAQADATRTLATQGIAFNPGSKFAQSVAAIGGAIGNIVGGGQEGQVVAEPVEAPPPTILPNVATPTYTAPPVFTPPVGDQDRRPAPDEKNTDTDKKRKRTMAMVVVVCGILLLVAAVVAIKSKKSA